MQQGRRYGKGMDGAPSKYLEQWYKEDAAGEKRLFSSPFCTSFFSSFFHCRLFRGTNESLAVLLRHLKLFQFLQFSVPNNLERGLPLPDLSL